MGSGHWFIRNYHFTHPNIMCFSFIRWPTNVEVNSFSRQGCLSSGKTLLSRRYFSRQKSFTAKNCLSRGHGTTFSQRTDSLMWSWGRHILYFFPPSIFESNKSARATFHFPAYLERRWNDGMVAYSTCDSTPLPMICHIQIHIIMLPNN